MLAIQLDNAITACEVALTQGGDFSDACRTLGSLLQSMGWFREAIIWHSRSLEPQTKLAEIYAGVGSLWVKQRHWQRAIAAYQQALQYDAHYAEAHRSLAGIYAQLGQRDEEIAYRYRAVILNPNWATPSNQLTLGNALIQMAKTEQAIDCYQRAIKLCPDFYEAFYNLAVAEISQQHWQAAKDAFQQALKLNPDHAESHYGLGKIAEQAEQLKTAATHYWKTIQLNPEFAVAYFNLGEILLKLRYWEKALPICYKAAQLNPQLSWAHHNLGYTLIKHQKWQVAFGALYRAIKLNPDFPWTYYHLGQVLLHQKHWEKAAAVFLAALQIPHVQTDLVAIYPRLGYALRRQARQSGLKQTIQFYRQSRALKSENRNFEFYKQLGDRLFQFKQFTGAVIFYSLAVLQQPNHAAIRAQVQQALTEQQRLDQEIAEHRREIQQHPDYHWLYSHLGNLLADQGELEAATELHQNAIVMRGWQCAASRNYQFTHDWFTHNVSTWEVHLKPFAHYPKVHALEIGSFEGMSACWLLDHVLTHPLAKLTCIDLFFQESFEANVKQTGAAQKLIRLTGDSHQILATLPSASYDFIYIDGCHLAHHVQQDAALAWRLLKVGGLMVFDDYEWIDPSHPGQETYRGIDAFLDSAQHQLAIVYQGYQVIVRKLKIPTQPIKKTVEKPVKTLYPSSSNPSPAPVARV
ncbi:MAG: tetratricopeptide repeat protein [Cyanobacteria bacterium RM1_2_2]|nr:tetratricopeptide repeat protein [Cyanobacteria bacterium RM1_2_2]